MLFWYFRLQQGSVQHWGLSDAETSPIVIQRGYRGTTSRDFDFDIRFR